MRLFLTKINGENRTGLYNNLNEKHDKFEMKMLKETRENM